MSASHSGVRATPADPPPAVATGAPAATVRTRVRVPLEFADGWSTTADVFTFDGLADGKEHLALGLGAGQIDLLSNNPDKAEQLERLGVTVAHRLPTAVHLSAANARYLQAKVTHTAHTIALPLAV